MRRAKAVTATKLKGVTYMCKKFTDWDAICPQSKEVIMSKALIKPEKAVMVPLKELDSSLVDQFQHEINTIFKSKWFTSKTEDQQTAFLFAGVATEGGEVVDLYKKDELVKGEMDVPHLLEELGDVMWHLSNIATKYGLTLADVMKNCMEKFRQKYPERYMEE